MWDIFKWEAARGQMRPQDDLEIYIFFFFFELLNPFLPSSSGFRVMVVTGVAEFISGIYVVIKPL